MAVEEHPFTIFEAEDFVFRIQFMVSVSSKENQILNFGFFKGRGNKGWIEKKNRKSVRKSEIFHP